MMKCKKKGCEKQAAKKQIYCSKGHAPYAYLFERQKNSTYTRDPQSILERIRDLAKQGVHPREIARQLKYAEITIRKYAKEHNIEVIPRGRRRGGRYQKANLKLEAIMRNGIETGKVARIILRDYQVLNQMTHQTGTGTGGDVNNNYTPDTLYLINGYDDNGIYVTNRSNNLDFFFPWDSVIAVSLTGALGEHTRVA